MELKPAWQRYNESDIEKINELSASYINFISENKTEREVCAAAIKAAKGAGYVGLDEAIAKGEKLKAGSKIWASMRGKAVILFQLGQKPLTDGMNILGAHIDSPRLDVKQNPLYESGDIAFLDTHYYGGIKHYQWVTLPLALHGVVVKKDGSKINIVVGEHDNDPVFCISDLLPHLGREQMEKNGKAVVEGEALDIIIGNRPLILGECSQDNDSSLEGNSESKKENVKKRPVSSFVLKLLKEEFGIEEEDFLSAELEVVPAGCARELGFDRSMVLGYGQDDRVCAYTSLAAQLAVVQDSLDRSALCVLVDKEEIGSVGASGMASNFFENTIAEIMQLAGFEGELELRRALNASRMLSSDVSAAFDPAYASVFETKNSAYLGRGLVFNKYTGARGKSGSNDARAEYMAAIRQIMAAANVQFQTCELGKVDAGGGGTIAYIPAKYGMDVIDAGVPILSMHSPWEVSSKADIYEARCGYEAFLKDGCETVS